MQNVLEKERATHQQWQDELDRRVQHDLGNAELDRKKQVHAARRQQLEFFVPLRIGYNADVDDEIDAYVEHIRRVLALEKDVVADEQNDDDDDDGEARA